jgi:cation diffusion facilitator CzcD-associated flavoprotein CzcO
VPEFHEVLVVGAGPAGLATSRELARRGVEHRVLERGGGVGHTWAHLYDSLVLHTGRHLSGLPGMPIPATAPIFTPRPVFLAYLGDYAKRFDLPIQTNADVVAAERVDGEWLIRLRGSDAMRCAVLVVATGVVANPYVPQIPGRNVCGARVIHSVDYLRPADRQNKRVLIVGAGNSAGEIAVELARAGARVTLAIRSGATIVPRQLFGIPLQYVSVVLGVLPRPVVEKLTRVVGRLRGKPVLPAPRRGPCPRVPLIGLALADLIRTAAIQVCGGITAFTPAGVRFDDGSEASFDEVILATGYRTAVGFLDRAVTIDSCGFPKRSDRVTSADQTNLFFVGHRYDVRGAIFNMRHDARLAAALIAQTRRGTGRTSTGTAPAPSGR